MLSFYSYPFCPFCRKVQIVLEEKNLTYSSLKIDIQNEENQSESFLALNPFGFVPVLMDDDLVLYESDVINEYLEEIYPKPSLLPADPQERARVRLLERVHDRYLALDLKVLYQQYFFLKPAEQDEALIAQTFKRIQDRLGWIDKQLEGRKYFGGDQFVLADAAFAHALLNTLTQFNIEIDHYQNICSWIKNVKNRPSIKKTDPGFFKRPQPKRKIA